MNFMVSPGIKARIERFYKAISRLRQLTSIDIEEFVSNDDKIDAAERNF